jgi:proteic killer suppression protein
MIGKFRDNWPFDFFANDLRTARIPADLNERLFRKLQLIDDAICDGDLRVPPSNHFEKLAGRLQGWHSIRVNRQWRLIFHWNGKTGEATDLYLDKHEYR